MDKNKIVRLTVVSHSFPPRVSATSLVLHNLFSNFPEPISAIAGYNRSASFDPTFMPPCNTEYLSIPNQYPLLYERIRKSVPALAEKLIRKSILSALKKNPTKIVLGTFPFDDMFVGAFQAAKQLRLPFYAYMQDLWIETMPKGSAKWHFAKRWEPIIFSEARRVICMTEAVQEHYKKKYGVRTCLLPHAIKAEDLFKAPPGLVLPEMNKPTVLFVGGLSRQFNLDALITLAQASEYLPDDYELLYSTPVEVGKLNKLGVTSSKLKVQYVPRTGVQKLMSQAHVLIAPLSHKNCATEEVRTLFSTKLLQYFLSGRPIIVFAPEDSYHAKSANKSGWGYVVSKDSPKVLAEAIMKVVEDKRFADNLVSAALKEAQNRNAHNFATRLASWIKEDLSSCVA